MSVGTNLIIRDVRPEEHARVGELLTEAYVWKDVSEAYLTELGRVSDRVTAPGARTLVAESRPDGEVLGTCIVAGSGSPLVGYARPGESGLRLLATASTARRRGVGRALVTESIARTRLAGHSALVLGTMADMTNAHRLYEAMGFRRMPDRDEVLSGGRPLQLYGLPVTPWPLIREARADELDAVGELTLAAYRADGHLDTDGAYAKELGNAHARAADAEVLVAVDRTSGELLGTATVCPDGSGYRELAEPDEGEFRMLGVAPSARGRGVGEALVRAILARTYEQGLSGVALYSGTWMPAAHRLYRRLGFERAPSRDREPYPGLMLLAFTRPV